MIQYDNEQAELETKIDKIKETLSEDKVKPLNIEHFISLIRRYKAPSEVTDMMFSELIDKIVVYEADGVGNARTQKVDIYFNYVGQVNIEYTEEELAEMQAQEKQAEKERLARQRAREKAYREKRKAEKIAANGGEIVKKKLCPHCGAEFAPTSNRQIFCSDECCYQARQGKKKADREAERGNHYYRQRKCVVCGKLYWPTHSQQTLCSDECKAEKNKIRQHNYYKRKQEKEKSQWIDLSQTKKLALTTNSSETTISHSSKPHTVRQSADTAECDIAI